MSVNDRLVWIDCEMTGLDIERDALIEIACLVTDGELTLLDEGVDATANPCRLLDRGAAGNSGRVVTVAEGNGLTFQEEGAATYHYQRVFIDE